MRVKAMPQTLGKGQMDANTLVLRVVTAEWTLTSAASAIANPDPSKIMTFQGSLH